MVDRTPGPTRARRATLADVARLAGVSASTASKALNGRSHVRPATRARVMQAAQQLSFSPNTLAQSLLAGRSGTVGLVTSDLEGRFVIPILMGVEDAFGADRVNGFLCDARGDTIREQYHVQALLSRQVDGIIVVGSRTDPRPSLGRDLGVPVVYTYAPSEDPEDLSIICDNVGAGRLAIEHLISCGRRRIAHITGDPGYGASRDRAEGALAALADAGLELVGGVRYGAWSEGWGRAAAAMLLDQHPDIDAIFCGSDLVARGVMDTLRERGRRIPDDIAVLGFDNWKVLSTNARPPLTSIDMNLEQLGRTAARALFDALDGRPRSGVEKLPCRIVLRGSTTPLA
ncbi:MAG TPA: LacI family DNA-binding transcriptional regulator [Microlunatus sp.]|nr:LacI family DNA-binding transcriptional regulator [Microlunatus sp.]